MHTVCSRCQTTFQSDVPGRHACLRCGQELWLDGQQPPWPSHAYAQPWPSSYPQPAFTGPITKPGFLGWHRAWCWTMAVCDLGGVAFGIGGATGRFNDRGVVDTGDIVVGFVIVAFSLLLMAGHLAGPLLPRSATGFWANIVVLGVSVFVCCWPLAIVCLLLFNKPEVRRWYGVQT